MSPRKPWLKPKRSAPPCLADRLLLALDLHGALAWVVIVANGIAGGWALSAHWVPAVRGRPLWWFVAGAQISIFLQVVLGAYLVAGEDIEAPEFHMFYGFVALIAVAIIYSYRRQLEHRLYLLYGLGELFVMGLTIRAMFLV